MKKMFVLSLLFIVSLLFAGGPSSYLRIVNLTGEDIFLNIKFSNIQRNRTGEFWSLHSDLQDKQNKISPRRDNPFPSVVLISGITNNNVKYLIRNEIAEINILNENGDILLNKEGILSSDLYFIAYPDWYKDIESYPGQYSWTGIYNIFVTEMDFMTDNSLVYSHQTTERLNLRNGDNISASVIRVLDKGERIKALQIGYRYQSDNYWVKIRTLDGIEGWCVSNYLIPKSEVDGYGYGLELRAFTANKTSVSRNESFSVNYRLKNVSSERMPHFIVEVVLTNNDGRVIWTLGTVNASPLGAGAIGPVREVNCTIPNNLEPGQYQLRILVKPRIGERKQVFLSADNVPISIDFLVR